jgi:hypothetical protein
MSKIVIEFARPGGALLRNIDAGFEFIDDAQIPWANAERRVRLTHSSGLLDEPMPLPDGLDSAVRVAAQLPLDGGSALLKTRVIIEGVVHELTVRVTAALVRVTPAEETAARGVVKLSEEVPRQEPTRTESRRAENQVEVRCPKCGRTLIKKRRPVGNEMFLACPDYPGCRYTRDLPE